MTLKAQYSYKINSFHLNVDIAFDKGKLNALFGRSGSGKSTLLKLIAGVIHHDGLLAINQEVYQSERVCQPAWKRNFSYLAQQTQLFPHLTVTQNIEFAIKRQRLTKDIDVHALLELFDISSLMKHKPEQLSGGEKQKVAIVRGLAANPSWLLMDEPVSAIDEVSRFKLLHDLKSYCKTHGISVLYVSHDRREVAAIADDICIIENGTIKAKGTFSEVAADINQSFANSNHALSILPVNILERVEDNLQAVSYHGHTLWLRNAHLAVDQIRRIQIPANEISISLGAIENTSVLNQLHVVIEQIEELDNGLCLIKVNTGFDALIVSITKRSVKSLKLNVGIKCFINFKALASII